MYKHSLQSQIPSFFFYGHFTFKINHIKPTTSQFTASIAKHLTSHVTLSNKSTGPTEWTWLNQQVLPVGLENDRNKTIKLTDFVKVEREIARQGAVKSRFEEGSPAVWPAMRSALVFLADSTHSRIDRLFAASKQETHTRVFTFVSFFFDGTNWNRLLFIPCHSWCTRRPFPWRRSKRSRRRPLNWRNWALQNNKSQFFFRNYFMEHASRSAWKPKYLFILQIAARSERETKCVCFDSKMDKRPRFYRSSVSDRTARCAVVHGKSSDPDRRNQRRCRRIIRHLSK